MLASDSPAQEPGPIAVISVRRGSPWRIGRSTTNRTVGADMLPYAARTSRSWSSAP
jgi:hypothetical protein